MRTLMISILLAVAGATPALAVQSGADAFTIGALHPVLGFDHLGAMVLVGLLSVQMGGNAIWTVPTAFVAVMGLGGLVGMAGVPLPEVEGAISLSVFALGLVIAMSGRPPIWLGMLFVAFFAVFHGHAHGAEMPTLARPLSYAGGFMLATALLHLTGVAIGELCRLARQPGELRARLGAGGAGVGMHMLLLSYGVF